MSRQWLHWDSPEHSRNHSAKLLAKIQRIDTLKALLEMWETHPTHDHSYILELRAKLRQAQNQLEAMQP